jgi:hypothetical protein
MSAEQRKVIEVDTIVLTQDVEYAAKAQDQGKALDEAVEWAKSKGWELVSVIWKEETDNGHVFIVTYNKKATAKPIPTRRNKD